MLQQNKHAINALLTATHSMISTYFGSITIVLKFPFTRAASTNGLHRYSGFGAATVGDGGAALCGTSEGENAAEVGVGDRLGRCPRVIERLESAQRSSKLFHKLYSN